MFANASSAAGWEIGMSPICGTFMDWAHNAAYLTAEKEAQQTDERSNSADFA